MSEVKQWITVNGNHVPIKEGESKDEAVKKFINKSTDELRAESIKEIKTEKQEGLTISADLDRLLGKEFIGYKGQSAVEKLLKERQGYVKSAFHRDDIGDIDLIWGSDTVGLQHIIKNRSIQGVGVKEFLSNITEVVEKGEFVQKNAHGTFEFWYKGKMAIISPEYHNQKLTFLLTAYKRSKK